MLVLLGDRWEPPGPAVCLAVGSLDFHLLSFATVSLVGVRGGTHLLCERIEGGLERRGVNWSAVLTLRRQKV